MFNVRSYSSALREVKKGTHSQLTNYNRNHEGMLLDDLLTDPYLTTFLTKDYLPKEWSHPQWALPFCINYQARQTDAQANLINSSLEALLSDDSRLCQTDKDDQDMLSMKNPETLNKLVSFV